MKSSYSVFWQYHHFDYSSDCGDDLLWDFAYCNSLSEAKAKVVSVLQDFFGRDDSYLLYQIQIRYESDSIENPRRLLWCSSFIEFGRNMKFE